ncbi:MAG: hypothetical protein RSA65_06705, partial [Clostridia bacterium]
SINGVRPISSDTEWAIFMAIIILSKASACITIAGILPQPHAQSNRLTPLSKCAHPCYNKIE